MSGLRNSSGNGGSVGLCNAISIFFSFSIKSSTTGNSVRLDGDSSMKSNRNSISLQEIRVTDLDVGKYTILVRAVTTEGIKSVKDAKKNITLK